MIGLGIIEAANKIRNRLQAAPQELSSVDKEEGISTLGPGQAEMHLAWMCDEVEKQVKAGKIDKAFRWLGFLQGACWALGVVTIEEMKQLNRGSDGKA